VVSYCIQVSIKIRADIERFQQVIPALKYVRGDVMSPDHWTELFKILEFPKGMILEKLLFGDILQAAPLVCVTNPLDTYVATTL
jgi:dynein heavy chain 2